MQLREILESQDRSLYDIFISLTVQIVPQLNSIETLFPEYTRHDPSYIQKLEQLSLDIIIPFGQPMLPQIVVSALNELDQFEPFNMRS